MHRRTYVNHDHNTDGQTLLYFVQNENLKTDYFVEYFTISIHLQTSKVNILKITA